MRASSEAMVLYRTVDVSTFTNRSKARRFTPASGWGAEVSLSTGSSTGVVKMAQSSNGYPAATWPQDDGSLGDFDFNVNRYAPSN